MSAHCPLSFAVRADKEKMIEKLKAGEEREEVDDSGFFAGKSYIFLQLDVYDVPRFFLFIVISALRWSSAPGGCDHHHGRRGSERDQPRRARQSHDSTGVRQNPALSNGTP